MILLDIHPKSRKGSYGWEHALKTAMGLFGTFGALFFFIFIGGGKSRNSDAAVELLMFFFGEHIEVTIVLCILAALLFNASAYAKNKRKNFITKIEYDESQALLNFSMISVYSDNAEQKTLPLKHFFFYESKVREFLIGSHKVLVFVDKNQKEFGMIDFTHEIHKKFTPEVKKALYKLEELKKSGSL